MSSPHSSPLSNHTLGSSTVPADHGANDGPSRRDLLSKLRHSRIGKNSELGRLWSARWVHPQRKAYIHAFIDTTACWFFALTLLYINNIYWVAETLLYTNDRAGAFLTLQTYVSNQCAHGQDKISNLGV